MQEQQQQKMIKCAVCLKEIPENEAIKKLHGAMFVCKDCDHKDQAKHKEGETCEFC